MDKISVERLVGSHSALLDNVDNKGSDFMHFKIYENVKSRPLPPKEENQTRLSGYKLDKILYCFSLTGSLANLTRFPYLTYTYNGCSFLVQFMFLVVLIGVPWSFMETALGQYSGRGPVAIGEVVPIGKGVAVAMGYICLINVICYSPIQSRCLRYMFLSINDDQLQWKFCNSSINNTRCLDDNRDLNGSKSTGIELRETAENFYLNQIVNMERHVIYDGLGGFDGPLLLFLVFSWIINFFLLIASDKIMKYIFGSIAPFPFLFAVLAIIMSKDNAWESVYRLFDPSTVDYLDLQSWRRAAEQVLYSMDVGTGHLIIYGQNCNFRNSVLGNIIIVTFLDIVCAVSSSLVVYGTAHVLAYKFHIKFESVLVSGPGMFFIAISRAMVDLPYPRLSSFTAFFVLYVMCILTQLSFLKPVMSLLNVYLEPYDLVQSKYYAGTLCALMFVLSLATVTRGGEILISLLDDIGSAMGILIIATFEAILIFGIYGINEFCSDLVIMSDRPPSCILRVLFIVGPVFTVGIILACSFYWIPPSFQGVTYPPVIYFIAWTVAAITLLILATSAVHTIVQFRKQNNLYGAFEPTDQWVPDIIPSFDNNNLKNMTKERESVIYDRAKRLAFGFGKPRLFIKVDEVTQTSDTNDENIHLDADFISNQRMQHFYLEVLNRTNTVYQITRRHNEDDVIQLDEDVAGYYEHLLENGVLEKYVQTD